jgi:signal transduction histidine kinase
MVRLCENLLWFARSELASGDPRLFLTSLDLVEVIFDVTQQLSRLEEGIAFQLELDEQVFVVADADRVRQMLLNLIENALRHGDGPVTVGLRQVGEYAVLYVHDEGAGVAEVDSRKIFDRNVRPRAPHGKGWGVGLPVVRGIAEAHGGAIRLVARDGRYNAFEISLPLDGPADA